MSFFTAEANGRPIVVLTALDRDDAYGVLDAEEAEFVLLGACGEEDEMFLRDAFDDESDLCRRQVAAAAADGELDSADEAETSHHIVFWSRYRTQQTTLSTTMMMTPNRRDGTGR
jgi:hypothetical protein